MSEDDIAEVFAEFLEKNLYKKTSDEQYTSIHMKYSDIVAHSKELADSLLTKSTVTLEIMTKEINKFLDEGVEHSTPRITGIPKMKFRNLGSEYLNRLISLTGIITTVAEIKAMVISAMFRCKTCDETFTQAQDEQFMRYPSKCIGKCKSTKFTWEEKISTFIDSQDLFIQETPENLPAGQIPRTLDLRLMRDLKESIRAGDLITITGVYKVKRKTETTKDITFNTYMEVNSVVVESKEASEIEISDEEEEQIIELSKDPLIHKKIIMSLAPSIYRYDHIKEAIMYLLFGGVKKENPDTTIRGEMNILLIGDPACAKSQLLRAISKYAPRAIYTSGRGSSAAGLTAATIKRPDGGYNLVAGALVLGDKGVVCIDEMDKMSKEDRVAIHPAMEQHIVTVNKGGFNTQLNARCAILGAANPAFGRYDSGRTIAENLVNFPPTLLSRFDLIFVIKDTPSEEEDRRMAKHILSLTRQKTTEVIPIGLVTKYIAYAKRFNPVMTEEAEDVIVDYYVDLRVSSGSSEDSNPIAITPRQLEGLQRLSEAHARIALRGKITREDADAAINILARSLEDCNIDPLTGKMNIDLTGAPKGKSQINAKDEAIRILRTYQTETGHSLAESSWIAFMVESGITHDKALQAIVALSNRGLILDKKNDKHYSTL